MLIKLEEKLLEDPRFLSIVETIGRTAALGDFCRLCFLAKRYWAKKKSVIPKTAYKKEKFHEDFLTYGLVIEKVEGYYLKGSEEHFADLFKRANTEKEFIQAVVKNQSGIERKVPMDFLDEELQQFISGVSDVARRRWLKWYKPETITVTLENALEWSHSVNRPPKNVAGLMNKFFNGVPKDAEEDCPIDESTQFQLESLLGGSND